MWCCTLSILGGTANRTDSTARLGMRIGASPANHLLTIPPSYCNSIIQCLYYSAPFRERVVNFPSPAVLERLRQVEPSGPTLKPPTIPFTPYPNVNSPARKQIAPASPGIQRPEDSKDHPDNKKKMALATGPVLDLQKPKSADYWMEETLFSALRDIFEAIIGNKSRLGVAVPHRFLDILRNNNEVFRSPAHQDAHEFLNLVLNDVVDNVELFSRKHPLPALENEAPPESTDMVTFAEGTKAAAPVVLDTNWVHDIFEGLLTSETRCLTCENTSQRDESFLDLSVDLEAHSSVVSCLRKFSEEEMLCERNKFHCDNCGGLQEAEKRMKIKRLPRILALHLKRFKWTEDMQKLQKLFHRVVYPFYLRMFNTTDETEDPDRLYELYAVVVHIGGGPYHGHYVSVIKTPDKGWMLFDDELVEPVSKDYVLHFFGGEPVPGIQDAKQLSCAYVLFYQETTLEAMQKEQDAEASQAKMAKTAVPVSTTDGEKNGNGIYNINTATTPLPSDMMDHMSPLKHAATSPFEMKSPLERTFTSPALNPVLPSKSKKELKQEEKDRKAAEKVAEKEREEKRRVASQRRMEEFRKADEEMKRVLEESKATAAEEAGSRGEQPNVKSPGGGGSSGLGLSRFRTGSISLRGKSKFLGGGKDKPEKEKLATVPQGNGTLHHHNDSSAVEGATPLLSSEDRNGDSLADEEKDSTTALPPIPPPRTGTPAVEEGKKKNRFSLGRKKSTLN